MTVGIRIVGLTEVQRKLGQDFRPAMKAATKAIALQVQGEIAEYPPSTVANSPTQRRWYERGYGPKWRRKDGTIRGRKTSETLKKRWGIKATGAIGHILGNAASYSAYLHSQELQARWAGTRGWITDDMAIRLTVSSGAVKRLIVQAIMGRLRGRV